MTLSSILGENRIQALSFFDPKEIARLPRI
jgi:hypothetical protein